MRFLIFILMINMAYAHGPKGNSDKLGSNEKLMYASLYADQLIEKFDHMLDIKLSSKDSVHPLNTLVYAKLLSARSYIESFDQHRKILESKVHLLEVRNPKLYSFVVNKINKKAVQLKTLMDNDYKEKSNDSIIYPSVTRAGNITGNTFPKGVWSLTFDDGPRAKRTQRIVDNLYKRQIKATFFMLTEEAKKYYSEAVNVLNSRMNIALHSYTHPNLNRASDDSLAYQITQAKKDLETLLNIKTTTFRLPYGAGMRNKKVRKVIAENGYVHIFWNIDTLDWKDKDPKSIMRRIKKQMKLTPKNSGIILFHDIHPQTVVASELAMDYLLENQYKICTVETVISYLNGHIEPCIK